MKKRMKEMVKNHLMTLGVVVGVCGALMIIIPTCGGEEKAAEPEKTTEKKTMSIAERARLASSLEESESEDKTEKPDESETADIASEEKTDE